MNTFDFEYINPEGKVVIVEVGYFYDIPDPYALDSDWDYKGGLTIDTVKVYSAFGKVEEMEIPEQEIAYQFKKYLRELELSYVAEDNEYF